jgi:hypothetical protein
MVKTATAQHDSSTVRPSAARTGVAGECSGVTIPPGWDGAPSTTRTCDLWFVGRRAHQQVIAADHSQNCELLAATTWRQTVGAHGSRARIAA